MAQMPIPDDWDGTSWCCHVVEWPASTLWRAILLGFISTPSRGRFWDASTGSVQDAQAIGQEIIDINCDFEEGDTMACLEDLESALEAIATAISEKPNPCCGEGTRGAGYTAAVAEPYQDNQPTPPAGYTDIEEYHDWKCGLARQFLDTWQQDINLMSFWSIAGLTLEAILNTAGIALLITIVTPIPLDEVIVLATTLIAVVLAIGSLTSVMGQASTYIGLLDECIVYNEVNVEDAIAALTADINAQVFPVQDAATKTILLSFVSTDSLNALFAEKSTTLEGVESTDCTGCSDLCFYNIGPRSAEDGTLIERIVWPTKVEVEVLAFLTFTACSEGIYRIALKTDGAPGACQFKIESWTAEVGSWTEYCCNPGCSPPDANDGYGFYTPCGGVATLLTDPADAVGVCLDELVVWSATNCQLRFVIVEP